MSASTITGAGGSFECPHLCQLSESLGVEIAGIAGIAGIAACRGVKVGSTWPQPVSNGQLLPGSIQQPCSLGAKEISDRFDALRPLLGQGHCHSVRGFKSGQVFIVAAAPLFCGRCAVALRMLLWFGCCQILLKHRSSQSVSCTEKAVSDDFSIPETLRLSMTFLILYRFLSVFLQSSQFCFAEYHSAVTCPTFQLSSLAAQILQPHLPHLWRPLHTGLYWLPLRSGTWLRPTDRLRPHWTGRFCIDSAFVDVTHSTPAAGWLSAIPVHVQVCAKATLKVISYHSIHSLGETLGTFGKQKISCWWTVQDQIEVSDCRECSLAPIPAFRTNQWYKNHQKPNHNIS